MKQTLKYKLYNNQEQIGTWCILPCPEVVNVLTKSGLDFVIIDFEHSPVSFETAQKMVVAAHSENKYAVCRVGKLEEVEILRSLDIGSDGIIIPHIESKEDVENALSYIKYYPKGNRGYSPYTYAGGYCFNSDYTEEANENILFGIIIESKKGIDNLDEILKFKELDMVYLGAYDISISLGVAGQINHPKVTEIIDDCLKKITKAGKIAGAMFHDLKYYEHLKSLSTPLGSGFWVYKTDSLIINEGIKNIIKK